MSSLVGSLVPLTLRRAYREQPTAIDRHASFGEHGVVLWCDIAKFSPLAKRLVAEGPTGVERLSGILNRHFDAVVETVTAHGGDAVQFYGDGVLVTFPAEADGLSDAACQALTCAEAILANCRAPVEPGLSLSLHLHLTAGDLRLLDFGGVGGERLYACAGDALNQLARIARDQRPDQIIISAELQALLPVRLPGCTLPNGGCVLEAALPVALRPRLQPAVMQDAPASLAAFLPAAVRHGLEIGAPRWSAELRSVTSLFVTLPGLDCADPAFVARIHELALVAQAACRQHEGVLRCLAIDEKGAGFNLIFGLPPYAHRDDADRALRCADDLLRELALRGQPARIGIATGMAFIGLLGGDLRRQHAVIGDAINLASRLSHLDRPQVLCDEATRRASLGSLRLAEQPPVQVKGWDTPRPVWSLVDSGPESDPAGVPLATLFGRDSALSALRTALDAAASGDGATVVLSGEPGMGKSALLAHAAQHARTLGMRVLAADCTRIEQATPYHALRRLYSALLDLDGPGTPEARRAQLIAGCADRHLERISLLNAVLPLGLPDSPWVAGLLPAERVAATRALLAQLLLDAALRTPLLLLIEDGHWIDDESLRLIERVARRPRGLTLLIAARPPALALAALHDDSDATLVDLVPLSRSDSAALIASRLEARSVDDAVVELIHARTEGNPFFVGELAQYLADRGELLRTADQHLRLRSLPGLVHGELPVSVRATILNRVDAMAPSTRLTLKVESVSGTRGPLSAIVDVHPLDIGAAAVAEHLQAQRRLGLVDQTSVDGGDGYAFRQEITRDVIYELVLPEMRQALHADLARWYETRHRDDLDAWNGRIAAHWSAAGDKVRAAGYLEREAIRVFSNGHALEATRLGLEALRLLGIDLPEDPAEVGAGIGREIAVVLETIGGQPPTAFATLPALADAEIARRIAALLAIAPLAFQSDRTDLYALAAITAMRLTLVHGSGADSAQVYSLYSVVHAAITGDRAGGAEWSRLALLIDGGGRQFPEVGFVYTWFHAHWQRPLRDSLGISLRAGETGLESGALMYACFNLSGHVIYQQAAGRPLAEVIETIRRHLVLNGGRVRNSLFHLIHELQYAKALAGLTDDPLSFTDAEYDEARDLASILDTRLSNQIGYYLVSRLKLACLHGRWDDALAWADRAQAARQAYGGQTAEFELVQYQTLAAAGRALESGSVSDRERIAAGAAELRGWADLCAANFAHKALLAEAALRATSGEGVDDAIERFAAAAAMAAEQGYAQDAALALDWITRVLRRAGRAAEAAVAGERAARAWRAYGALALAERAG